MNRVKPELLLPTEPEIEWTKLELTSVKPLDEAEAITSLDRDTLMRVYPDYIVKLSPRRYGIQFRNILKIVDGSARAALPPPPHLRPPPKRKRRRAPV
jgi:hypothetical protein